MPQYVLFQNGRACTLKLKGFKKREGSDIHDFEFDFVPRKPTPAEQVAFERELFRLGVRTSDLDIKLKKVLRAVWNARGIMDAEAVQEASKDEDEMTVTAAVGAILRNGCK